MPRKTYAKAEIEAALAILDSTRDANGQPNFSRAARDAGIQRKTLIAWDAARKDTDKTQKNAPNNTAIAELEAKLRGDFTERANELRNRILNRIAEVLPVTFDIAKLADALTAISNDSRLERGQPTEVSRIETHERLIPDRAKQAIANKLARDGFKPN
jgi:hypothetical protein